MKRVVHKARNFKEAQKWDIMQMIKMTPDERQKAARALKDRYYGRNRPDVRASERAK